MTPEIDYLEPAVVAKMYCLLALSVDHTKYPRTIAIQVAI